MSAPEAIDRWLAQQACRDLVMRAGAFADANDPDSLAALFLPDGELVRPASQPLRGRAAIAASYRARSADRITRHLVTNTLVSLQSPTRARATSLVLLWSGSVADVPGPYGRPARGRQVVGEFDDLFTLVDEGWRIARREARFVLFKEDAS